MKDTCLETRGVYDDLQLSDDSSDDDGLDNIREAFKRKAGNSPDNNEFDTVLSKKDKKKFTELINKSR